MMKFLLFMFFMYFMIMYNNMMMFYYNLFSIFSLLMVLKYMFKDMLWMGVSVNLSYSYYSIYFLMLSSWIIMVMLMCFNKISMVKMNVMLSLVIILYIFFLSLNLMMLYLMFEVSIIPTFMLIVYWGMNFERVSSSYYLVMYMLLISFPMLVYMFMISVYSFTMSLNLLMKYLENYILSFWFFMFLHLAFMIKMPIYLMHLWLPKAHVEAPVYGSMLLAGILLKMGGYGLILFLEMFYKSGVKFNYMIISLSVMGSMLMTLSCLIQIDMKKLVAYSSVVHMNLVLCSLFTMYKLGVMGGYIMMVSHGLCSSGMFYMVNLYYKQSFSRVMMLNKGMLIFMPSLMMWWFMLCVINFSFPISLSFVGEIFILMSMLNWEIYMMLYLMIISFFSSAYSLYLYSYISYSAGSGSYLEGKINEGNVKNIMVLVLHLFPLVIYLLNMIVYM